MADSQIRWKRGDFIKLGRAVSDFNKRINELKTEENKLYLPENLEYSNVRDEITTRRELNRFINSLKRFQKEGAENLYTTEAGEILTNWERNELSINARVISRRLNKELNELNEAGETGFSRVQMGSIRAREIEAQLRNLKTIESKKGYEFNILKNRLKKLGTSDYEMKKATVYRENYLEEMKKYRNFEGYDKLINKLYQITNPIEFFKFMSKNELTKDLTYQSDQFYSQQEFNLFLESLGIKNSESDESVGLDFLEFKREHEIGEIQEF